MAGASLRIEYDPGSTNGVVPQSAYTSGCRATAYGSIGVSSSYFTMVGIAGGDYGVVGYSWWSNMPGVVPENYVTTTDTIYRVNFSGSSVSGTLIVYYKIHFTGSTPGPTPSTYQIDLELVSNPPQGGITNPFNNERRTIATSSTAPFSIDYGMTAIPNHGWHFVSWTGSSLQYNTEYVYLNFRNTGQQIAFYRWTANFAKDSFEVSTSVAQGRGTTSGDGTYEYGDSVTIVAVPAAGYAFEKWVSSDGNVVTSATYTFSAYADVSWSAYFIRTGEDVVVHTDVVQGRGTTSGDGLYETGSSVEISATPANGYKFVKWVCSDGSTVNDAVHSFTAYEDVDWHAYFEKYGDDYYDVFTHVAQGNGTTAGDGAYKAGTTATITAVPAQGFKFSKWVIGGTSIMTATHSFYVTEDVNCYAYFTRSDKVIVQVVAGDGGISSVSGGGEYEVGSQVTISAEWRSIQGYYFDRWVSDFGEVVNVSTHSFTATRDVVYTAYSGLLKVVIVPTNIATVTSCSVYSSWGSVKVTLNQIPDIGQLAVDHENVGMWANGGSVFCDRGSSPWYDPNSYTFSYELDSTPYELEIVFKPKRRYGVYAKERDVSGGWPYGSPWITGIMPLGLLSGKTAVVNKDGATSLVKVSSSSTTTVGSDVGAYVGNESKRAVLSDASTYSSDTVVANCGEGFEQTFSGETYSVSVTSVNGTVSGTGTYNCGTVAKLTAVPNEGFHFVKWSDGYSSHVRFVCKNASLTAEFASDSNASKSVAEMNSSDKYTYSRPENALISGNSFPVRSIKNSKTCYVSLLEDYTTATEVVSEITRIFRAVVGSTDGITGQVLAKFAGGLSPIDNVAFSANGDVESVEPIDAPNCGGDCVGGMVDVLENISSDANFLKGQSVSLNGTCQSENQESLSGVKNLVFGTSDLSDLSLHDDDIESWQNPGCPVNRTEYMKTVFGDADKFRMITSKMDNIGLSSGEVKVKTLSDGIHTWNISQTITYSESYGYVSGSPTYSETISQLQSADLHGSNVYWANASYNHKIQYGNDSRVYGGNNITVRTSNSLTASGSFYRPNNEVFTWDMPLKPALVGNNHGTVLLPMIVFFVFEVAWEVSSRDFPSIITSGNCTWECPIHGISLTEGKTLYANGDHVPGKHNKTVVVAVDGRDFSSSFEGDIAHFEFSGDTFWKAINEAIRVSKLLHYSQVGSISAHVSSCHAVPPPAPPGVNSSALPSGCEASVVSGYSNTSVKFIGKFAIFDVSPFSEKGLK